jgi:hypothetical protein
MRRTKGLYKSDQEGIRAAREIQVFTNQQRMIANYYSRGKVPMDLCGNNTQHQSEHYMGHSTRTHSATNLLVLYLTLPPSMLIVRNRDGYPRRTHPNTVQCHHTPWSFRRVTTGLEFKHNKAGVSLDGSEGTGVPSS